VAAKAEAGTSGDQGTNPSPSCTAGEGSRAGGVDLERNIPDLRASKSPQEGSRCPPEVGEAMERRHKGGNSPCRGTCNESHIFRKIPG
jgi:hypothetical protein